jgi:hypothetical protein
MDIIEEKEIENEYIADNVFSDYDIRNGIIGVGREILFEILYSLPNRTDLRNVYKYLFKM